MECIPALGSWDTVTDWCAGARCPDLMRTRKRKRDVERETVNGLMRTSITCHFTHTFPADEHRENESVIKMIIKGRRSNMYLHWLFEQINLDPAIQINFVKSLNKSLMCWPKVRFLKTVGRNSWTSVWTVDTRYSHSHLQVVSSACFRNTENTPERRGETKTSQQLSARTKLLRVMCNEAKWWIRRFADGRAVPGDIVRRDPVRATVIDLPPSSIQNQVENSASSGSQLPVCVLGRFLVGPRCNPFKCTSTCPSRYQRKLLGDTLCDLLFKRGMYDSQQSPKNNVFWRTFAWSVERTQMYWSIFLSLSQFGFHLWLNACGPRLGWVQKKKCTSEIP